MKKIIKRTIIILSMVGLLIFGVGQIKGEAYDVLEQNQRMLDQMELKRHHYEMESLERQQLNLLREQQERQERQERL